MAIKEGDRVMVLSHYTPGGDTLIVGTVRDAWEEGCTLNAWGYGMVVWPHRHLAQLPTPKEAQNDVSRSHRC